MIQQRGGRASNKGTVVLVWSGSHQAGAIVQYVWLGCALHHHTIEATSGWYLESDSPVLLVPFLRRQVSLDTEHLKVGT
jgi:hypothetical protein